MNLYLDTSALLKLYAKERGTSDVRAAVARAEARMGRNRAQLTDQATTLY